MTKKEQKSEVKPYDGTPAVVTVYAHTSNGKRIKSKSFTNTERHLQSHLHKKLYKNQPILEKLKSFFTETDITEVESVMYSYGTPQIEETPVGDIKAIIS